MTTMTLPVESYQAISEQCKEQQLDTAEVGGGAWAVRAEAPALKSLQTTRTARAVPVRRLLGLRTCAPSS